MRSIVQWMDKRPWITSLILIFIITSVAFIRDEIKTKEQDRFIECLNIWADQATNRNNALSDSNRKWRDSIDGVFQAVKTQDRAIFQKSLDNYYKTSTELINELKVHPIPESPKFSCR